MSSNGSQQVVQKLWNYCNILRDDGLSYGDYVEQLTYLLFLKMAHERTQPPNRVQSRRLWRPGRRETSRRDEADSMPRNARRRVPASTPVVKARR